MQVSPSFTFRVTSDETETERQAEEARKQKQKEDWHQQKPRRGDVGVGSRSGSDYYVVSCRGHNTGTKWVIYIPRRRRHTTRAAALQPTSVFDSPRNRRFFTIAGTRVHVRSEVNSTKTTHRVYQYQTTPRFPAWVVDVRFSLHTSMTLIIVAVGRLPYLPRCH